MCILNRRRHSLGVARVTTATRKCNRNTFVVDQGPHLGRFPSTVCRISSNPISSSLILQIRQIRGEIFAVGTVSNAARWILRAERCQPKPKYKVPVDYVQALLHKAVITQITSYEPMSSNSIECDIDFCQRFVKCRKKIGSQRL